MKITTSWKEEGRLEGRLEGRGEGRVEGRHESLLTVLRTRFGEIPESIADQVQEVESCESLDVLLKAAVTADSLPEFRASLRSV